MEGKNFQKLLTPKEVQAELLLQKYVNEFQALYKSEGMSADFAMQEKLDQINRKISNEVSVILSTKYKPVLKEMMTIEEEDQMNNMYGRIFAKPQDDRIMDLNYKRCFRAFMDDTDCVSIKAENEKMLKNISARDAAILTLFSMVTTKRTRNDNILQLIVSGTTSSGK